MEYNIGADESVSMAVVQAVSTVEEEKIQCLPPLANVVDTDALDALFRSRHNGTERTGGRLSFVYNNCLLTIDNGEYLTLTQLESHHSKSNNNQLGDKHFT